MDTNYLLIGFKLFLAFLLVITLCMLIELLFFHHETIAVGNVVQKAPFHRLIVYTGSETIKGPAEALSWAIVREGDQVGVVCIVGNLTQIRYKCRVSLAGE